MSEIAWNVTQGCLFSINLIARSGYTWLMSSDPILQGQAILAKSWSTVTWLLLGHNGLVWMELGCIRSTGPLCLHLSVLPVGFEASVTEITRRRLVISSRNGVWQLFCMKLQDSKRSETQEMLRDTGCCRTGDTCCWHITPSKSGTLHWICLLLTFMYLKRMHECTERDLHDFASNTHKLLVVTNLLNAIQI